MNQQTLLILAMLSSALWGIAGGMFLDNYLDDKKGEVVGLYFGNERLKDVEFALKKNERYEGDWVVIDVKQLTYPEAVQVCEHEVAHHMFDIRKCNEDPSRCLGMIKTEEYARFCENNIELCINNTGISYDDNTLE